jgi:lipopolysaccharide/colanic/teichoic acid biosynthesis glycosyltransferase
MSLVGPRPEDSRYVALYSPEQQIILKYRPGITSMASFEYRSEEQILAGPDWEQIYIHKVMPIKLAIDIEYMCKANLISDMQLILHTIFSR